jgi:hypothetical protein
VRRRTAVKMPRAQQRRLAEEQEGEEQEYEEAAMQAWREAHARDMASCQAIGEFIYNFSQLEFAIKAKLANYLGLDDAYFDIVLGDVDFAKACMMLKAAVAIRWSHKPEQQKVFHESIGRALELNRQRVIIAHGTWSPSTYGLLARKVQRGNLKAEHYLETPAEIQKYAGKAYELTSAFAFEPVGSPISVATPKLPKPAKK